MFTVPYEFYGQQRAYEPDFVVRMADGFHLILEVKGNEPAEVAHKHQAAQRWVTAVNRWGRLGRWSFLTCHDPQLLVITLAALRATGAKSADESRPPPP